MSYRIYPAADDEVNHPGSQHARTALAARIDLEMSSRPVVTSQSGRLSTARMSWLLMFIEANLRSELSVPVLASHVGLSPDRLARVFKATTGISPHQFILGKRLELAARMLTETELPIGDIGAATGFSDAASFGRAFKKRFSVSPGTYRKGRNGH